MNQSGMLASSFRDPAFDASMGAKVAVGVGVGVSVGGGVGVSVGVRVGVLVGTGVGVVLGMGVEFGITVAEGRLTWAVC